MLRASGTDAQVINAGITGEYDLRHARPPRHGGAARDPAVIVQGGYNDLQRGSSAATIGATVEAILARLKARGIRTVLCGFYDQPWDVIARRTGAVFAGRACYDGNYRGFDGLHMNATGHQVVAARLLPAVRSALGRPGALTSAPLKRRATRTRQPLPRRRRKSGRPARDRASHPG